MRFVVALVLTLVACNSSSPTEPSDPIEPQSDSYIVQYGRSVQVNSDLQISFTRVIEDSRCPATVQCVWAGNGKIRLSLRTGRGDGFVELNTTGSADMPREASALGYTFTLLDLQPYPQTTDQIPPSQYTATIRVTRTR